MQDKKLKMPISAVSTNKTEGAFMFCGFIIAGKIKVKKQRNDLIVYLYCDSYSVTAQYNYATVEKLLASDLANILARLCQMMNTTDQIKNNKEVLAFNQAILIKSLKSTKAKKVFIREGK